MIDNNTPTKKHTSPISAQKMGDIDLALAALQSLCSTSDKADALNKKITKFSGDPDFRPYNIYPIHGELQEYYISMCDALLIDNIASYYYYEANHMKDGGHIVVDGREYPIRTLEDVKYYVIDQLSKES